MWTNHLRAVARTLVVPTGRTVSFQAVRSTQSAPPKVGKKRAWLKWLSATTMLTGGAAYIGHLFTPDWRQIVDSEHYYSDWKLRTYFSLPLNFVSRFAGGLAHTEIPVFLRPALLGTFARMYDCRLDEAENPDLSAYPTFGAFFNRKLKKEARPISHTSLVSPADGRVLHFGVVDNGKIEYVKGHDYAVADFVGDVEMPNKDKATLYQVVIYLAPGNYHAFHSPARWKASSMRHYPGLLLSVRPALLEQVPHLFCLNERVVMNGSWKHGFFSMSAVAATNVGDIVIDDAPSLRTNLIRKKSAGVAHTVQDMSSAFLPGDRVGEFRLGSTVVLVFQGPPDMKFAIKAGDSVRFGQSLVLD